MTVQDTIQAIDSHTEGEPTRVITGGVPMLEGSTMTARRDELQRHHDWIRSAVILEPRGSEAVVGAVLTPPLNDGSLSGVIFFNNTGYLGMCIHGTIGVARTLQHLGRLEYGTCMIDTPVGAVELEATEDGRIAVKNVPCWRYRSGVVVEVPGHGPVQGEIAWGGNWFYLTSDHGLQLQARNIDKLTSLSLRIRQALHDAGIFGACPEETGIDHPREIDHIELTGPPTRPDADSRNFVLCPGGAYDRSPCGTGTSAHIACLAAEGVLAEGDLWRQESILGSMFKGSYTNHGDHIIPTIRGRAWITGETTFIIDPDDPFRHGIVLSGE